MRADPADRAERAERAERLDVGVSGYRTFFNHSSTLTFWVLLIRGFGSSVRYLFNLNIRLISSLTHQIFVLTILSMRYVHFSTFSFVSDSTAARRPKEVSTKCDDQVSNSSNNKHFLCVLSNMQRTLEKKVKAVPTADLQFRKGSSHRSQLRRCRRPARSNSHRPLQRSLGHHGVLVWVPFQERRESTWRQHPGQLFPRPLI